MKEHPIEGHPNYYLSENGDVISRHYRRGEQCRKLKIAPDGSVTLRNAEGKHRISVKRLVAQTFIENPEGKYQCYQIDGDIKNTHPSNIRWGRDPKKDWNRSRKGRWTVTHYLLYHSLYAYLRKILVNYQVSDVLNVAKHKGYTFENKSLLTQNHVLSNKDIVELYEKEKGVI